MKELIRLTEENGKQAVSARELHQFLVADAKGGQKGEDFSNWIKRMIAYLELQDGFHYSTIEYNYIGEPIAKNSESDNQRVAKRDYVLSIESAKEISMIQNNNKGQQARRYFIACEKKLKEVSKPHGLSRKELALMVIEAEEEKERLQLQIEDKTMQLDESKEWFSIKRYAKLHKLDWRRIKWRSLKAIASEHGYEVKKIFDANYGKVNIYHKDVFQIYFAN